KITNGVYVPDGIIPIPDGGGLIQEGADNIDINTETIDGKDTFHSMARAVFQIRHYNEEPNIDQSKIKRTKERSIQIDDSAFSLSACMPFVKPKTRETPPIGKLWGDGGLKDLLVDSSVYASGTVDQMLNGKEFNRAVRALTLAFEALHNNQIKFKIFETKLRRYTSLSDDERQTSCFNAI
ncbi:Hypothetical predicted protein, partial [Mytilus galloprovincialis]